MTRLYGWGPKNQRLIDHVPHSHWITTSVIFALRSDGVFAVHVMEGAMNHAKFLEYIRDILGPMLRPGDVVTCDNLSVHKGKDVADLLATFGATQEFIPPYSSDENPIENSISKVKSVIAKREIREIPELREFLGNVPELFTPAECCHYFQHAGYCSQ